MRLLVLGATGFIGEATLRAARAAGHEAFGLARRRSDRSDLLRGDRNAPEAVAALVDRHRIDAVVDVVAWTEATTRPLLTALDGRVDRYVLLGSADVYANYELLMRTVTGTPTPVLREDAPLRTTRHPYRTDPRRPADDPDAWRDDYDKIPIEEAVRALQSPWTILRLPMVFGAGDRQHRFRWAIRPMLEGRETLTIPPAWARWVTTFGYVEDVGAAIVHAATHPAAARRVLNVGERTPVAQLAWARRFATLLDWSGSIESGDASPLAATAEALDLAVPLHLDTAALYDGLGFAAPTALDDALRATVAAERGREPAR